MNIENDIKVSVCVVTYNQENYIAECLESLVTQQTSFKFEIIVGEDCSTDTTRAIVQSYVEKYPDLIVPLFYESNVGAVENLRQIYLNAKGKYIAHMDGDDMALPNKLQKQFDTLENNLNCQICTHDVLTINYCGEKSNFQGWRYAEGIYTYIDLLKRLPFFAHSSKMFRNNHSALFWDNLFSHENVLDIEVHYQQALLGFIYHINDNYGCYRSGVGVSMGMGFNPNMLAGIENVYSKALIHKISKDEIDIIRKAFSYNILQYAYNYAVYNNDVFMFKKLVYRSLKISFLGFNHIIFLIACNFPKISFYFFRYRNTLKYRKV